MANYPQEPAQDAVCQSHTGHMTGLWFLPTRPLRLNTNEWMNERKYIDIRLPMWHFSQYVAHFCYRLKPNFTWLFVVARIPYLLAQFTPSRNSRSEDDALWQTEENVDEESESEEDYCSEEESNNA